MTETPDETQTPDTVPPPEWTTPNEEEQAEQEEAEQTPAEAAAARGSSDIPKRIERAVNDQRRRLGKILDIDLAGSECPTCGGMGFTVGAAEEPLEFAEDATKEACPTCRGLGQLISHSKAPGHELVVCIECAGQGWRNKQTPAPNVAQFPAQQTAAAQPRMGFLNPDGSFVAFGDNTPQTVPQSG
jgi:hypothetical protein